MNGKTMLKLVGKAIRREARKEHNMIVSILAVIGLILLIAIVLYAIVRFMTPDEYEGYDDAEYDTSGLHHKEDKD